MKTLYIFAMCMFFGCKSQKLALTPVPELDLQRYSGTWYEIARLPNSFEKGLKCITATYTMNSDGTVKVVNRGHKTDEPDKVSQATGKAKVVDNGEPGKLKVTFFWPFYGKYWVLKLDESYSYAVVGEPSGKYLWFLSRTPKLDDNTIKYLLNFSQNAGFKTGQMIFNVNDCE